MRHIPATLLLLACLGPSFSAEAAAPPTLNAARLEVVPALDGEVRNDPAWRRIRARTSFTQNTPDEGAPASQRTELRIAWTDDALWVAFVCHDDQPEGVVVSDARRDGDLKDMDAVRLILDTYHDRQNGFVFGTNPSGMQYDGQFSNAGGSGLNLNWDGVWDVRTQVGEFGWSAEFRIPFTTLRYPEKDAPTWGANFERRILRRHEVAYWAPLGRQFGLTRLADAGRLKGLEFVRTRNLKITPYALGEARRQGDEGTATDTEFGVDLKYSITPALTLDLTLNTDFAQVEADEVQISLDRFNLFFPEKRPFFLENAGLFTAGRSRQVELFFSRRIGLSDAGEIVPIDYGARLSGGVGGVNLGLLHMRTDGLPGITSATGFTVARVNKELPNRSSVGAILVDKAVPGAALPGETDNRTWGADARWGIGDYGLVTGYLAQTDTPGLDGDDRSWSLAGEYDSPDWSLGLTLVGVGEHFNPEVGFVNRSGGYRSTSVRALRRIRFGSDSPLLELRPHFSYTAYWDPQDFKESGFLHIDNHTEWKNGYELHTGINFDTKGLQEPFEIFEGVVVPAGNYHNAEVQLVGFTDDSRWLSFEMRVTAGGFYSGDRVALSPSLQMRLGEKFTGELGWSQNDVDLPEGEFTTRIGRLRMTWSFSPSVALEALLQYNNRDDVLASNLRFSWLRKANTGLYLVFNDVRGYDAYTGAQPDRSLVAKYTYLFDI
jgi:hypothetical protein